MNTRKKIDPIWLKEMDQLIRVGKSPHVRKELGNLSKYELSNSDKIKVAQLSRRVGRAGLGVRILNPIVRPRNQFLTLSKEDRRNAEIEYANCLIRMGLINEGTFILSRHDSQFFPAAAFALASGLMKSWNYKEASEILENYLKNPKIQGYKKTVGQVNLVACYVALQDFKKADPIFENLFKKSDSENARLVYQNTLSLWIQRNIETENYKLAFKAAEELQTLDSRDERSLSNLISKKWSSLTELYYKNERKGREELKKISLLAKQTHNWETHRDCEYRLAVLEKDVNKLKRLYQGTPHIHFKSRIEKLPFKLDLKGPLVFSPKPYTKIDLLNSKEIDVSSLKLTYRLQSLVKVLCSDQYKPFALHSLFSQIYPNEYFDPESSCRRTYQLITRLRLKFRELDIPFEIIEFSKSYRIKPLEIVRVSLSEDSLAGSVENKLSICISHSFDYNFFTVNELNETTGFSHGYLRRVLSRMTKEGVLERRGRGRGSIYRLAG